MEVFRSVKISETPEQLRDRAGKAAVLATLNAIREPSETMLENDTISTIAIAKAYAIHTSELPCDKIWRAMIDALIAEIENSP